jgi:flavin reductase (DIM6/NTAB) family NADH-FMN oxidoreductase RutF
MEYAYAIKEAPVSISCVVKSVTELGSHDMFIGEIKNVTADSYLLDQNGKLCLDNARLVAYNHGEYYLLGEKLGFFGYSVAKEDVIKRRMGKDTKKGKK